MTKLNPESIIRINPDYLLFIRNNSIIAGNLRSDAAPVSLQPLHLLLLDCFAKPKSLKTGSLEFQAAKTTKILAGNLPMEVVYERLSELISQNILQQAPQSAAIAADSITVSEPSFLSEQTVAIDGNYKVHKNFSLVAKADALLLMHKDTEAKFSFSMDMLFTLLSLGHRENIRESENFKAPHIALDMHWRHIHWFIKNGILIKKNRLPEKTLKPVETTIPWNSNVNYWKSLPPTNKIPVYFVPHTQNHYPLALGLIQTAIRDFENGRLLDRFELIPITYMSADDYLSGPYRKFGSGVWLFSNYLWSVETNLAISKFVKQNSPRNITIHGGPSTPDYEQKCEQFFIDNSSVDIAVHGEGEVSICETLDTILGTKTDLHIEPEQLKMVNGISYRDFRDSSIKVVHTASRVRMKDPNVIPSPYQTDVFDYYDSSVEAAIIETNRGCPFGCTFCDWGSAINQKVRKFDLDRVRDEIKWSAEKGTKVIWIADANFGMYDRDIEVADYIIQMKNQYGFPQEVVVNYTKNTTTRLVDIIKIFSDGGIISQGVISIQTHDTQTLEVISRKNIKLDKYEELRNIFQNMNLPLSTDLMLGLPGSTIAGLKNDLQHYIDADVSVKAYPTQLLPNSPMADPDYIEKYKITTSENGYLSSSYSYTSEDLEQMKALYKAFTMSDGYGLLRYVVRFLQWEYGIPGVDFIYDLLCKLQQDKTKYPLLAFALSFFDTEKCIPTGWGAFYEELRLYLIEEYQVVNDSALNTVLEVNKAAMPDEAITYPHTIDLEHDFIEYFKANSAASGNAEKVKLKQLPASTMVFNDSDGLVDIDDQYLQYDSHQFFWELDSDASRTRSAFAF